MRKLSAIGLCLFPLLGLSFHMHNPWYFEIDAQTYKVERDKNDHIDLYKYDRQQKIFQWTQNLSEYAQSIEYFMENVGLHYVAVVDESGHTVVYKWRYTGPGEGYFYVWG